MESGAPRSILASVVGWLIVAIVVYLFFGWIVGTLFWLLRMLVVLVLLGGLFALYLRLRRGPSR